MTPVKSTTRIDLPPVVKRDLVAMFGDNVKLAYQRGFGYVVRLRPEKDFIRPLTWDGNSRPTAEDQNDLLTMHGVLIGGKWGDWEHVKSWIADNQPKALVVYGFWQMPLFEAAA